MSNRDIQTASGHGLPLIVAWFFMVVFGLLFASFNPATFLDQVPILIISFIIAAVVFYGMYRFNIRTNAKPDEQ